MDEALRARARDARQRPDAQAALAHAQALERAGDRRGAARELARAARLGSEAARERLDAWAPWPGGEGGTRWSRADGLRASPTVRTATLAGLPFEDVVAASARTLFVRGEREVDFSAFDLSGSVDALDAPRGVLAGIALDDLSLRFEARTEGGRKSSYALLGDDLLRAEGHALVLHDGATGEALAQARLPAAASGLAVEGDRGLLALFGAPAFVGVDLAVERFGEALWESSPAGRVIPPMIHLRAGRAFVSSFAAPVVPVLEDGRPVGQLAFARGESGHVRTSDARGVLLSGARDDESFCEERDPQGEPRWRRPGVFSIPGTTLTPDLVITVESSSVVAFERARGEEVWRLRLDLDPVDDVLPSLEVVVARDVVYAASANGRGVAVLGLDLATGKELFHARARAELATSPYAPGPGSGVRHFGAAPIEGGVALLARRPDGALFVAVFAR